MIREDVVLYADGGDMTVGRRTGVFTWGNFDVVLPEGWEQEASDQRLQDGFISRPLSRPVGRFDIGFVRADARIDLEAQTSDLEMVIDTAQKRAEGALFFERDITGRGLGRYQPGVDFNTGDIVYVEVWGKRIFQPVTAVELLVSDSEGSSGTRVHVGGQLVADAATLRRHNDALSQQIAAEKRQRLKEAGQIRETADTAKSTADTAKTTADEALDAVNDADGLIQSSVEAANQASADSRAHSKRSSVFSGQSVVHSEQARQHSDKSAEYSDKSWDYSQESKDHAEDSYFWSDESSRHSADSQTYSQSASTHSIKSRDFSITSSDYSEASNQASLASQGSAEDASDHADWAEEYRRLAEVARNDAETFRRDAEEARRLAELGRSDAEAARDRAEQSRKRAMQSMSAAEMMRAMAEQERKKAELARADAEDDRKEAEIARDAAEQARSEAEGHRNTAFNNMQEAFTANSGASQAAVEAALSAQESAEKALEAQMVGWRKFVHPGPHGLTLQDDRVGVTILPNGLSGQISYGDNAFWAGELFGKVYYTNNTVEPIYSKVPFASSLNFGGGNTPVKAVEVDYRDSQRKGMRSMDGLSTGWAVPANNSWYQYKTGRPWSVTVAHPTELTAVFSVGWDATGHMGSYSIQARVNGTPVRTVKNTEFGPLFFWQGGGYRIQLLNISGANALQLQAGDTVSFWVIREREGNTVVPGERRIRDFSLSVTWSEPGS